MRKHIVLFTFAFLFLMPSLLYAFGGCEEDCLKCHTLTNQDAQKVLKPIIPDVTVEEVRIAPAKGLWEVTMKTKGQKGIAYVDFSLKNIIVGQIVQIDTKLNLTQKRMMEISKVDVSLIDFNDSLVMGDEGAKHKVLVFDDPD